MDASGPPGRRPARRRLPATAVPGRVVNDLVHLLAELLENATSFSSPQTKVRVTGHALPDGRVLVEIHDTGSPGKATFSLTRTGGTVSSYRILQMP